jgi:hypothetical protein
LNGTFGKLKFPLLSVVVLRSYSLTGLWMLTVAFGTTAPDESTTVPEIDPELPVDWAKEQTETEKQNRTAKAV